MRPVVSGLNHLTLAVTNLERSRTFYVELLGCVEQARWDRGSYLSCGDLWLCLSLDVAAPRDDYTHIAFSVDAGDMPSWRERVEAAGVPIWQSNSSEGESIYVQDPDGHRLELHAGDLASRLAALRQVPYDGLLLKDDPRVPFAERATCRLVALAGSVRRASVNRAFVSALKTRLPASFDCETFDAFERLPIFSPDKDRNALSLTGQAGKVFPAGETETALAALFDRVRLADVVLIACPEYAGGLPGAFKNALDLLVGSDAFIDKPFVLCNLAPRASKAQEQLRDVLQTMSGVPIEAACCTLDVGHLADGVAAKLEQEPVATTLRDALVALERFVERRRSAVR